MRSSTGPENSSDITPKAVSHYSHSSAVGQLARANSRPTTVRLFLPKAGLTRLWGGQTLQLRFVVGRRTLLEKALEHFK